VGKGSPGGNRSTPQTVSRKTGGKNELTGESKNDKNFWSEWREQSFGLKRGGGRQSETQGTETVNFLKCKSLKKEYATGNLYGFLRAEVVLYDQKSPRNSTKEVTKNGTSKK